MAQKTQVILIDDVTGEPAQDTVRFGLDGVSYEIDLSDAHAEELRRDIEKWIKDARRVAGRRRQGVRRNPDVSLSRKMREWALGKGYEISDRGRIPADIQEAYYKEMGDNQ